ncbi:MAG: hypothetical protein CTY38_04865 [Methylotenera sp.]|uniref:YozE family protein n=1 Tax=Methylotenera sp. TaxID=2051956 RepID=UPI000D4C50A9|nr:MAG: hypothetical protein CTY38_04865 [Methylotenera sp.]
MGATAFYQWIVSQTDRRDVVVDFTKDVKRDGRAPKGNVSPDEWISYLVHSQANRESIQGFDQAWSEFTNY